MTRDILRPIYIEKEEGVGSVLGRIQKTSEKKLALVFPPQSLIFSNVLEVEFLKKELDKLGKDVVIITSDFSQTELAKGLGFKSSEDIKESEEADKFLEDFYGKKESQEKRVKVVSPLIKPKMSDILTKKEDQDQRLPKGDIKGRDEQKKEAIEEEILPSPHMEPISLTEEDLEEKEELKQRKERKLSFKIKPKINFSQLTQKPLQKIFVLLLLAAVGVFVLTATFIFPRAEVIVKPAREKAQLNIDLVFDAKVKAVDFEKNLVPSQIFKITKTVSQEFSATKEEDIKRKAEGTITIYNAYSSASQTLVKTTRFESPEGKIFRITKTITVPGAKIEGGSIIPSSIDAEVVADEAGEANNIGPTNFTIPGFKGTDKYQGFYGKSSKAMAGGLIKKGLVVGKEDVVSAEASLKEKLVEDATAELKQQLGKDFKLIEASLEAEIIESEPNPKLGEPATKFTLSLKALAQGFAYREKDLSDLIEEKIALKISDKRLTLPETQTITFTEEGIDFASSEAAFNLLVEEDISWKITEDRLKEVLAGKNEVEAREAIKLFSEIESARVSLWPFWLKHIPKDYRKIRLTVDY